MKSALKAAIKNSQSAQQSNEKKAKSNTPPDHTPIRSVHVGDSFAGVYYVRAAYEKIARNNNVYSDFTVADCSGEAFVRHWNESKGIKRGDWIAIIANVEEYQGKPQIIAQRIEKSPAPEQSDMIHYIPISETKAEDKEKFEKYVKRVEEIATAINDPTCKYILDAVFTDSFKEEFFSAPASERTFYGMVGGLLSHTVKVTYAVGGFASQYSFSHDETCVAVSAALLHYIGAVAAFEIEGCQPAMTVRGKLNGIKQLTLQLVDCAIEDVQEKEDYNDATAQRLVHVITAQTGEEVLPMTKEAILLAEAVSADMKLVSAIDFIEQDINEEEFTAFDPVNRRQYFKGIKK